MNCQPSRPLISHQNSEYALGCPRKQFELTSPRRRLCEFELGDDPRSTGKGEERGNVSEHAIATDPHIPTQ